MRKRNQAHTEWLSTGKIESLCKIKKIHKRVQSAVRWSKTEYSRRQFEKCAGDFKKTYMFLDLKRTVPNTSEIIRTVKKKNGDRIVNKTEIATAFNGNFVEIGEKLVSRLPEVEEPPTR